MAIQLGTPEYERLNAVLEAVFDERESQDEKWGEQNHPDGTGGGSSRLNADGARALCEERFARGEGTWNDILSEEFFEAMAETDPAKLREELIQVAAVAVSWVEAIDRRTS